MTVANDASRIEYTGNGVTVAFTFPFRIVQASDLLAFVDGVQRLDIVVTGGATDAGGTLTFGTAPGSGSSVWLIRETPQTQPLDLHEFDTMSAEAQERAFDRITLLIQELQAQIDRTAHFSQTAHLGLISPIFPLPGAGQFIRWNAAGLALETAAVSGGGGGGGGVTSLNGLTGAVTLVAGLNVTITPFGNSLTISAAGGGGGTPVGAVGTVLAGTGASSAFTATPLLLGVTTTGQAALAMGPYGAAAGQTGEVRFFELNANGTMYVGFKAPDSVPTISKIWTLPGVDGTAGQMLQTDGALTLSWATPPGGGGGAVTGTGVNGRVAFWTGVASLSNSAGFLWDAAASVLTATNARFQGSPWYDVKAYGAIGNGIADDTVVINAATLAAGAAGGGVVFLPAGTYLIDTTTINMNAGRANVHLKGAGMGVTIIKRGTAHPNSPIFVDQTSNVRISDLTLDGNDAGNPTVTDGEILIVTSQNITVERVRTIAFRFAMVSVFTSSDVTVKDCVAVGTPAAPTTSLVGIYVANGTRNLITGNVVTDCALSAIQVDSATVTHNRVSGNAYSASGGQIAVNLNGGTMSHVAHNMILGGGGGSVQIGIEIGMNAIVTDNTIDGMASGGIYLHGSLAGNQIVMHNTIRNSGIGGGLPAAIFVEANTQGFIISENRIYDTGAATTSIAVAVQPGSSSLYRISGNLSTLPIADGASSTTKYVEHLGTISSLLRVGFGPFSATAHLTVVSNILPVRVEVTSAFTNTVSTAMSLAHVSSGSMVDGFAVRQDFILRDTSGVDNVNARLITGRSGADNTGTFQIQTAIAGVLSDRFSINGAGDSTFSRSIGLFGSVPTQFGAIHLPGGAYGTLGNRVLLGGATGSIAEFLDNTPGTYPTAISSGMVYYSRQPTGPGAPVSPVSIFLSGWYWSGGSVANVIEIENKPNWDGDGKPQLWFEIPAGTPMLRIVNFSTGHVGLRPNDQASNSLSLQAPTNSLTYVTVARAVGAAAPFFEVGPIQATAGHVPSRLFMGITGALSTWSSVDPFAFETPMIYIDQSADTDSKAGIVINMKKRTGATNNVTGIWIDMYVPTLASPTSGEASGVHVIGTGGDYCYTGYHFAAQRPAGYAFMNTGRAMELSSDSGEGTALIALQNNALDGGPTNLAALQLIMAATGAGNRALLIFPVAPNTAPVATQQAIQVQTAAFVPLFTVDFAGGVSVGNVGTLGNGTINVQTNIFKAGVAYANPHYVFEHYFTGRVERYLDREGAADYRGLRPLAEVETFVSIHSEFPLLAALGPTRGLFDGGDAILATLEEGFLYLFDHERRLLAQQREIETLTARVAQLEAAA